MINWAYVAGFFDGEGCLSPKQGSAAMYQKDNVPLEKIRDFLQAEGIPCSVYIRKTPRMTNFLVIGQESCLRINGGKGVLKFLRNILPYMQTSKRVAVQDYLRYKTIYPPMTLSMIGKLGRAASRSKYGIGLHDEVKRVKGKFVSFKQFGMVDQ